MSTDSISRVNYFSGEALLTADFQDEQCYHKQMRELLSQGLLTPGILDGLDVEWNYVSKSVTVRAGRALDNDGRLIVLAQDTVLSTLALEDGTQNYLTITYAEHASEFETTAYGEGNKRWVEQPRIACSPDFDPSGNDILLAVVAAEHSEVKSVFYYHGNYKRQRVSAVLQSVQFGDESHVGGGERAEELMSMSIGAIDQETLEVKAPKIELAGAVTAESMTATGSFQGAFNGEFSGTFSGDGRGLQLPSTNYWSRDSDGCLFYTGGRVGVNVTEPTATFTVGQPFGEEIGVGLVTAISSEKGIVTLQGYQTNFTSDLVGKILQFGVVLEQEAMIASVDSDESLTLSKSFPLGLGPTSYGYKSSESEGVTIGAGKITPDGVTVHGHGTQFSTQLKAGDTLVIDRFVPDSKVHESKIDTSKTITDSSLALTEAFSEDVTDSGYLYSTVAGRWISGAGTISSKDKEVTGAGTKFTDLPQGATLRAIRALEVVTMPQTWRVDAVADTTHLTMHKVSIDEGSPVVPMMSAFAVTTWPLLRVGGGERPDVAPALTVVQNNGSVPNTVAINVDDEQIKIDSSYALQVNGPVSLSSLDVDKDLKVEGNLTVDGKLTVTETATIDQLLTASEGLAVKGETSTDTLVVAGQVTSDSLVVTGQTSTTALTVAGKATIATLDATNATVSAAAITSLEVTGTNGIGLTVDGAAKVDGTLTTDGALTVSNATAKAGATINGNLVVTGTIQGKLDEYPSLSFGNMIPVLSDSVKKSQLGKADTSITLSSTAYTAAYDGFYIFTAGDIQWAGERNAGFGLVFYLKIHSNGVDYVVYSTASRALGAGPSAAVVTGTSFMSVPLMKGDSVDCYCMNGGGADSGTFSSIDYKSWFRPLKPTSLS
jgi:cytoskeletal protein CcmA (bactofilin family)